MSVQGRLTDPDLKGSDERGKPAVARYDAIRVLWKSVRDVGECLCECKRRAAKSKSKQ